MLSWFYFFSQKSIFDKLTSLFLFSWSSIGLSVKGDTLVLMVNGVEKEYATLHRSEDDSKTMADGKVHLLYDSTGRTSRDVSLFFFQESTLDCQSIILTIFPLL